MVSVPKMPANSSASRTAAVRSASLVSMLRVFQVGVVMMPLSVVGVEGGEVVDAAVDVGVGGLEGGVGVDSALGRGPTSAAAAGLGRALRGRCRRPRRSGRRRGAGRRGRRVGRGSRSSPWRSATATARGWTRGPGWVPAEVAGMVLKLVPGGGGELGAGRVRACRRTAPAGRVGRLSGMRPGWRRPGRSGGRVAAGRSCGAGRLRTGPDGSRRRPRAPGGGGRAGCCPGRRRAAELAG